MSKRIDFNPWARAKADAVLSAVTKYARETGVAAVTSRGARVTAVTECFASTSEEQKRAGAAGGFFVDYELDVSAAARERDERLRAQGTGGGGGGAEGAEEEVVVERRRLRASTVIVATGTLGRPMAPEERGLPSTASFKGVICNACRHEEEWNEKDNTESASSSSLPPSRSPSPLAEGAPAVAGKKVVVLGSGAFALEAAERAAFCGAESVTIVCRPHEQLRERERESPLFFRSRALALALARSRRPSHARGKKLKKKKKTQLGRPLLPPAPLRPTRHRPAPPRLGLRPRPLLRALVLQGGRHRGPGAAARRQRPSGLPRAVLRRVVCPAEGPDHARDDGEDRRVFGKGDRAGEGGGGRGRHPGRRA